MIGFFLVKEIFDEAGKMSSLKKPSYFSLCKPLTEQGSPMITVRLYLYTLCYSIATSIANVRMSAPFFSSTRSELYRSDTLFYYHGDESPSFPLYSECKRKVLLRQHFPQIWQFLKHFRVSAFHEHYIQVMG